MNDLEKQIRDQISKEILDRGLWPKAPLGAVSWNQAIRKAAEIARGSNE
jgi:hypothetical protein